MSLIFRVRSFSVQRPVADSAFLPMTGEHGSAARGAERLCLSVHRDNTDGAAPRVWGAAPGIPAILRKATGLPHIRRQSRKPLSITCNPSVVEPRQAANRPVPRTHKAIVCTVLVYLTIFLANSVATFAQAVSPLPPPTGYVNDYAGVIEPGTKQRMEAILTALKQTADIEFAVVTVKTTGDQDIFDYSLAVARGWGIGSKGGEKNGLLLLVAVDDRKYFTQVSDHLEGDLPDGLVGEIGRRMRDPFRKGDYSAGLMAAVQTIVSTLQEKRGFKLDEVDPNLAYREPERASRRKSSGSRLSPCALVFLVIIVIMFLLASRGRGGGGGCLNMLFLGSLLSSGRSGGGFSSGWSGGGFGGSSGGGGGGFGGFGGGGSFGGGGAGGSW